MFLASVAFRNIASMCKSPIAAYSAAVFCNSNRKWYDKVAICTRYDKLDRMFVTFIHMGLIHDALH